MRITFLFLLFLFFASCTGKKDIGQFDSRTEMLAHIRKLSPQDRANFFKQQVQLIDTALAKVKDQTIYFSFSMGLSSGNPKEVNWDTVNWNQMDIQNKAFVIPNPDTLKAAFESYANTLKAVQSFGIPHSSFELDATDDKISETGQLSTSFKQLFQGNTRLDSSKVGLLPVSQALVEIKYQLPHELDSLVIAPNAKTVKYLGYDLMIDTISPQGIELDLPLDLYYNYLGHRGKIPNDKLVESNSYSAMPLYGLHPEIQKQAKSAGQLFQKFQTAAVEDAMLDRFEPQFTEAMFQGLKKLNHYQSAIEKELKVLLGDNKNADVFDVIKKLREYIESNGEYLGPVEQRLSISFPYPVKQFLLYFGKSNETIKAERRIPVSRAASYGYMTYLDQEAKKYGIVDSMGNVIIEPRFKELTRSSQDYFFDSSDSIDYFLNVKDKKLEPVKAGYRFERKLDADLSVFKNKKEDLGVLRNGQEEIVPFKYTAIEKQGKLFVAKYTLRGRETFDLYTLKGDLIETPLLSTVDMLADSSFMVRSKLHKFGVLNTSGKLVIPLEYDKIEGLKTANWVYATKGRETFLLDYQNKRVDLPANLRYVDISRSAEGMIPFSDYDGYGFIDLNGRIVIQPQYSNITEFYRGHALVRTAKEELFMIDKNNGIFKKIVLPPSPDGSQRLDVAFSKDGTGYFTMGEIVLDKDGNVVHVSIDDLY